jgi:8-oxo-dGTP diphosphatase
MPYAPILATLAYVLSPDRSSVLMIHRDARPDDYHLGKCNGLGGKLRADEDIVAGVQREVREEAGIECEQLRLAGTVSWPGFGPGGAREGAQPRPLERSDQGQGEDWFGFIFRVDRFSGEPRRTSPEGTLGWVPLGEVMGLPLWEGDRNFLPLVFAEPLRPFHGVMPYRDGRPVSWSYTSCG